MGLTVLKVDERDCFFTSITVGAGKQYKKAIYSIIWQSERNYMNVIITILYNGMNLTILYIGLRSHCPLFFQAYAMTDKLESSGKNLQ
jgi:hypothetical protein